MRSKALQILLGIIMLCFSQPLLAQQNCGVIAIDSAEFRYNIGRIDDCIEALNHCLKTEDGFTPEQRIQAYHLLAKCYLANDMVNTADSIVEALLLLKEDFDPDFNDPARLKTKVAAIKANIISSVSKKSEDVRLAPATAVIISEEEIAQRGYNDLIEVLKDIPGFDISIYYGQLYANVYQRGLRTNNTEKTLLLIDGVEENDLWSNFADISQQYPITNIKRIEVIYGPASTMYGPNAFSGVINVITKDAGDYLLHNKSFGIRANIGAASYNSKFTDLSAAFKKGIFSITATARLYRSDRPDLSNQALWDYDPSFINGIQQKDFTIKTDVKKYMEDNHILNIPNPLYKIDDDSAAIRLKNEGYLKMMQYNREFYAANANEFGGFDNPSLSHYFTTEISVGDISLGFTTWNKEEGIGTSYTDLVASVSRSRWKPIHNYTFLKYDKRISSKVLFTAFLNYRVHTIDNGSKVTTIKTYAPFGGLDIKDLLNGVLPSTVTTYYYEQSEQFRSEFKLLYSQSKNFSMISGVEFRNSQLQGYFLTSTTSANPQVDGRSPASAGGNNYNVNDVGVYSQASYKTNIGLGFTLGARLDYNQVRLNEGLGYHLSPRIVVDYNNGGWVIKSILSRGIENVSNYTKFDQVNIEPNPNLKPESIYNYEISATKNISDQLSFSVDGFYSNIRNVVNTVLTKRILQNQNIGRFDIKGLQANLRYASVGNDFETILNYTYTLPKQTQDFDAEGNPIDVDLRVGDIASHKINAIANYCFFKKLNINWRSNYVSEKFTGDSTTVPRNRAKFKGYFLSNLTLSVKNIFDLVTLQIACNNMFNEKYYSPGIRSAGGVRVPDEILQMRRNFLASIKFAF